MLFCRRSYCFIVTERNVIEPYSKAYTDIIFLTCTSRVVNETYDAETESTTVHTRPFVI